MPPPSTYNLRIFEDMMAGLSRSGGVMFQLSDNDVVNVNFGGIRQDATDDFRNRCAYWILDIPRPSTDLPECFPNCNRAILVDADLSRAALFGGKFEDANLSGADFTRSTIVTEDGGSAAIRLSGADLTGATFVEANLTGASLNGAILHGADLRRAYLGRAWMPDADLRDGARTNADFGVRFCVSGPRTDRVVA